MLSNSWDNFNHCQKPVQLQQLTAKEIIEELMRQGVKQEVIAIEANINQSTVSRILTGKHRRVRYKTEEKLIAVLVNSK